MNISRLRHCWLLLRREQRTIRCLFTIGVYLLTSNVLAQDEIETPAPARAAVVDDVNVLAVLETNPTTPAELVRAIGILIELKQAPAAKPLVEKLAAAGLDDQASAALVAEFGPATFLKIARNPALAPVGKTVADAIIAASATRARDPQRIAELVKQLADPSAVIQAQAIEQLRLAGAAAVNPLLETLANPNQAAAHAAARRTLLRLGSQAAGPLIGALEADDAALVTEAATTLAQLGSAEAVNSLLGRVYGADLDRRIQEAARAAVQRITGRLPSQRQAADFLEKQAIAYLNGQTDLPRGERTFGPTGPATIITLWRWDATNRQVLAVSYSPEAARAVIAAQLASDAFRLTPMDGSVYPARRIRYLVTLLATAPTEQTTAKVVATLPASMQQDFTSNGKRLWLDALDYALTAAQSRAAIHLANLLGESGDTDVLIGDGEPSPLVQGLASYDRAVRFAALHAIVKLKPRQRFVGSSLVPITLGYFIETAGAPKAVVAANDLEEAGRLAGLLAALGYETATATTGPALFEQATNSADVDLIVIDANLSSMPAVDAIVQFRQEPRTALVPIALLTATGEEDLYRGRLQGDRWTGLLIRPQDSPGFQVQIDELNRRLARQATTRAGRVAQAKAATKWAGTLQSANSRVFDFRELTEPLAQALYVPELTAATATSLAMIGRPQAQRSLLDFASGVTQPIAARQIVALAFCDSVGRYGILLTSDQMQSQYDRYNRSAALDTATQQVLSAILDCLEAGRAPGPVATP